MDEQIPRELAAKGAGAVEQIRRIAEAQPYEYKLASEIVVGDYLPFTHQSKGQGQTWWLEVVTVAPKRTRVWITVWDGDEERWTTRPAMDTQMAYKEAADLIAETN